MLLLPIGGGGVLSPISSGDHRGGSSSPLGLVLWTAIMANWNLRNAVKFRDTPPTWTIYLLQWMSILVQWYEHPFPTLPRAEIKELHAALGSMKDTGILQHPLCSTHGWTHRCRDPNNNRGEIRAALHAIRHRNPEKRTLICSDSQLVVMGATGKASKWQRHNWQGCRGPVGHVDLWEQLLQEITRAGPAVRWLHVPSHVRIHGNTKADTLADTGRRRSPLLKGLVTAARRAGPPNDDELEVWRERAG